MTAPAQPIKPIKLTVSRGSHGVHYINAHYPDGRTAVWGTQKTERGIRSCMTKYAKKCGLSVAKTDSCFDLTATPVVSKAEDVARDMPWF